MLELGISQAQAQFAKLLNQKVTIIDKKSNIPKAVILPFEEYKFLIAKSTNRQNLEEGVFSRFVGILDDNFKTDDIKYNEIIKWKYL